MKRFIKNGLAAMFAALVLFGGLTVHTVAQSQHYTQLVNYVGIVRGATQRLVKLELAGQPSDELVDYLDGILLELTTGRGEVGLPLPSDSSYRQKLADLNQEWGSIKERIGAFRRGEEDGTALLALSEVYFEQANDTVFAADEYASHRLRILMGVCVLMLGNMLLTWAFILWAYFKKMLRLEHTNQQLSDLARRDPLTGVYQLDRFKEEAQRLLDTGPKEKMAVVYTDFADFKYMNDVFGYTYGDSILKQYGQILNRELRAGEVCGRVSADNFVLLLQYTDKTQAAARMRAADEKITRFMHSSRHRQAVPTCCGICCVEDVIEDLNIDGFLDRANFARKTVKTGGSPNYVYYDESIRTRLREEKAMESRMVSALKNREFTVFYQPKVALDTGRAACAEALVRWRSPEGRFISPDRFIPVFEQKYMIDRLDQYVFEEVCRFLYSRIEKGLPVLPVSVNVSRLQFYDQNFIPHYVAVRDRYGIPPSLLEIEFTESIAVDNAELMARIVAQLRQAGFACSIDDFGKGYSSLSLLKSLPIDILKIDSFFFDQSSDPQRDMAVVQGVIDLAKKLHMRTVAEGVEHLQQVEALRRMGCDYVQGYVFFRPMPEQDYALLLSEADAPQPQSAPLE